MILDNLIKKKKKKEEDIAPVKETKNTTEKAPVKSTIGKIANRFSDGYQIGDISKSILDVKDSVMNIRDEISPVKRVENKAREIGTNLVTGAREGTLLKGNKGTQELKDIWSDGFQPGDIGKTKQKLNQIALGTGVDTLANLTKGELQTAEGLVDAGRYLTSDAFNLIGKKDTAEAIRNRAIQNTTGYILGENDMYNNPKQGWSKKVDDYSLFGDSLDQISQSVGQQAFRIGLQNAMGSAGASEGTMRGLNQLEIFAGSYGSAKSEALASGADNKTATIRGFISGTAEWISENMFDAIPEFKTGGIQATNLKNTMAEAAEKALGKNAGKYIIRGINSAEEGIEEGVSNGLETAFTDIMNYLVDDYNYGMQEGQGLDKNKSAIQNLKKLLKDTLGSATSKESSKAFLTAMFSTLITAGMSSGMTESQRKQVINGYAKDNNISTEKATELFDTIRDLRLEQRIDENTGYEQKMEMTDQATRQLAQEYIAGNRNGQKLDLYELYKQTPKSRKEAQFTFTDDEAKAVKTDRQKALANDLARINNEKSVHKLYKTINAIQSANDTQQYHIITTEGLYEMGIVNKDANGNYVMPDGSPYVPRGLNYKNGEIYINADVGSQSGTQAVYHEMLEGFKKASPEQYNQFKQMITDIIGEKNIQKEFDTYKAMYGEELTDDIRDEIINDKFGELAENQNFINKIADNRNVLEKFIDSIKNMIKYVKGTDEERQLMKLQKNLETEFAKRYKETDFSQGEGDTAYSLAKHYGDLGKGNDTYYGHMYDSRRSTGHFGTGTYFVGEDYQPGEHSSYANRPVQKVEFDDYDNLFKPADRDAGFDLHDALKEVNYNNTPISKELYDKLLPYYEASFNSYNELLDEDYDNDYKNVRNLLEEAGVETEEPQNYYDSGKGQYGKTYEKYLEDEITEVLNNYDRYQKAERDLKRVLGITDEQFNKAIEKVRQTEKEYESHSYDQKLKDDSLSTVFMKTLGYNGVDVRGLEGLDDTTYGSVIYDLDKKTNVDEKINNLLLTNSDVYDMVDSRTLKENGLTVEDLISKDLDDIDKLEDAWRKANYENSSKNFHEVPIEEAVSTIRNNNTFWRLSEGWFRGADSAYKPNMEKVIIMTPELRNAGMNIAYENYKNYVDKNISFDDFINKEITLYRGSNDSGFVDADKFVAFSFRKDMVEKYFGNRNKETPISELKVKIKDTLGSYQTTGEAEVLVPRNIVDKNNIRYSLTTNKDSQGRELSPQQQEYFKDTKIVDNEGNLLEVYRGEPTIGKTTYESKKGGGNKEINEYGIYFTNSKDFANDFAFERIKTDDLFFDQKGKEGEVKSAYLNITNPLDLGTITEEEIRSLYPYASSMAKQIYDEDKFVSDMLHFQEIGNHQLMKTNLDMNDIADNTNYDGLIAKLNVQGDELEYAVFNSNQIKSTDNLNPTENDDIRLSLTSNENIDSKEIAPIGSTVEETIAPIREDISNLTDKIDNLSTQLETMQNGAEMVARNDIAPSRALNNTEIAPEEAYKDENYWKSLEEFAETNTGELDKKVAKKLSKNMAKQLGLKQKQLGDLQNIIEDAFNKGKSVQEIKNDLDLQFGHDSVVEKNNEAIEAQKLIRQFPINVSPNIQKNIADYGYWKQFYFGKIKFSKDGDSVDSVYQQLNALNPAMFPGDIWNETDQLLKIAEVADMDRKYTVDYELPQQTIDEAANYIHDTFMETMYANAIKSANDLEESAMQYNEYLKELPAKKKTRQEVREFLQNGMGITTDDLQAGNDISSMSYNLTTPERVNEKVFGREIGRKINNETVYFAKHQEAERTRFLNKERQEIKDLGIKARSKESELVQKYGEGLIDDIELANEIQDKETQDKIKNAAKVLRSKYDTYLDMINVELIDMGYDPIPKRKDYMRHFQELTDKFSMAGIPFNRQDMNAENLPTDINGLTEFNAPGKNWFASALKRKGEKTTYDAITGIDGYLEGASNLMYHTETIQRYRTLEKLIRDTYGQTHGLEEFGDDLSTEEAMQRIQDIEEGKLSNYAAWIHEQANAIAGKKSALDRGVERALGRKAYTLANTLKKQTGSNMTGFNVRSAMTNFISSTIAAAKTNKLAMVKGTVDTIKNIFNDDGFINRSDFLTSRFGSDSLSKKTWDKISNAGQIFMTGSDWFTSNLIVRSKYYEGLQNGMTEDEAMNYANDFGARVMGDRSKGATAEAFNSKTLGILTQFQLETNNQWQYMIHDTKMDYQKMAQQDGGLKAGATVLFQMGQLAAYSYLFNEMFEKLTGSRAAFDIADIIKKLFGLDDDDKDKTFEERMKEAGSELVDALPFASLFGSGGRLPIGEMLTPAQTVYDYITGGTNKYGQEITLKDVGKDLRETLPYYVLPTGYGQLKKTKQGLEMYSDELPVAGSYTDSGNLRFTADEDTGSMIKNALFGKWADTEAKKYRESGYKTIRKEDIQEMKDLGMKSSEYRDYKTGLKEAGTKNADKIDYINSLDIPINKKNIMAENVLDKDIDMRDYNKYGSYAEFDYAYKNPEQYLTISQIADYDTYNQYKNDIQQIRSSYSTTNERKAAVQQYIEGLDLNKYQKIMLQKMAGGYSIKSYKGSLQRYIDSLDLTASEKQQIDNMLFK